MPTLNGSSNRPGWLPSLRIVRSQQDKKEVAFAFANGTEIKIGM